MANMSTGGGGWPGPVVGADAPAAAGSPCSPVDGAGRPARSGRPLCVPSPSAARGDTGLLSLSLETKALSDDAGWPTDDELWETAVVLPVSVANPIRVSRESVEGDNSTSETLDSDMVGSVVVTTEGFVCLFWPQQQPCVCSCSLEVLSPKAQIQPWLPSSDAPYSV